MTTEGCHLCENAIVVLQAGLSSEVFEVDLVDIAFDDALMDAYATRIPVLREPASGRELGWPFGPEELEAFLDGR
ncbi:MAG: glutaredoxin family protein [Oceanospirillaceae bacterium]|nr:glutaredoxin family protein [Oceanospirillaceae bacterium]